MFFKNQKSKCVAGLRPAISIRFLSNYKISNEKVSVLHNRSNNFRSESIHFKKFIKINQLKGSFMESYNKNNDLGTIDVNSAYQYTKDLRQKDIDDQNFILNLYGFDTDLVSWLRTMQLNSNDERFSNSIDITIPIILNNSLQKYMHHLILTDKCLAAENVTELTEFVDSWQKYMKKYVAFEKKHPKVALELNLLFKDASNW
jgi:hypothetical protein